MRESNKGFIWKISRKPPHSANFIRVMNFGSKAKSILLDWPFSTCNFPLVNFTIFAVSDPFNPWVTLVVAVCDTFCIWCVYCSILEGKNYCTDNQQIMGMTLENWVLVKTAIFTWEYFPRDFLTLTRRQGNRHVPRTRRMGQSDKWLKYESGLNQNDLQI